MTDQKPVSPSTGPVLPDKLAPASAHPGSAPDWDALARYIAGESFADEAAAIERFLAANPADREVLEGLTRLMDRAVPHAVPAAELERALTDARQQRQAPRVLRPARGGGATRFVSPAPWISVAAAVTVILTGALLWQRSRDNSVSDASGAVARSYRSGLGSADSVRLPDGSRVVLAPQSELIVSADYGARQREVELRGVGYFDVTHDDARPFTVRSRGATIRDVGTIFTVRSDSDGSLRVGVQEGAVLIERTGVSAEPGVLLHQGDLATMSPGEPVVAQRGVVGPDDAAWTSGRLVFRESSLSDVASELRRWYGVELRAADERIAGRHLTAEFRGEPLDQIVRELSLALDAGIERRGDTLVVRSTGGKR